MVDTMTPPTLAEGLPTIAEMVAEGRNRRRIPGYARKLEDTVRLIEALDRGSRSAKLMFAEAMSTSDFPLLFGDVLDRELLAAYQALSNSWPAYTARKVLRDFREAKMFRIEGGGGALGDSDLVEEGGEYRMTAQSEASYSMTLAKYGRVAQYTWEALINDDLDALRSLPATFARAAARGEERKAASLLCTSGGPDSGFFKAGNGNLVSTTPALSVAGIAEAFDLFAAQTDSDGEPIEVAAATLVIPPALEVTARNVLDAVSIEATDLGGSSTQKLTVRNWIGGRLTLAINPYLATINTTNGATAWYVVADGPIPATTLGFLRGHETPELFVKAPDAQRLAGGADPMDGDFASDGIAYKVRHVFGGSQIDPKMAVASPGV